MTVLTAIRQERHSAPKLSVIVFAWLSMLVSPCSMSLMPVGLGGDSVAIIAVHDQCPDDLPAKLTFDLDCGCDRTTLLSADSLKPFKLMLLAALPISLDLISPELSTGAPGVHPRPPLHESSPPVYLVTQRFRI
jgi:hypothetical protein